ncbi:hypothetical protein DP107_09615 [Haloglomus irregulare]|uniref:Uncharacterized protein n=1 Tax=Haloglomus irregulare TaxID=2234134 RepID=A0A554N904_9EURY|nr:hypothetical protein DP107_09615 [Haloglomus irregulare]
MVSVNGPGRWVEGRHRTAGGPQEPGIVTATDGVDGSNLGDHTADGDGGLSTPSASPGRAPRPVRGRSILDETPG